ncbi:MAG TPA: hypothetical protein VGG72_31755 [Bryobacteraceae bacterium]
MSQLQTQTAAINAAVKTVPTRRFVVRFVVSSISSLAGLISFVLTGPTMSRIAAVDPALEVFYGALVVGWFASLGRMWFLTFRDRIRQ